MSTARIKQDAEKADQMIREMSEQNKRPAEGEQDAAQQSASESEQSASEHVEATDDQGTTQTGEDQGQQGGDDSAHDTSANSGTDNADDWKHKYLSLNGMLRQRDQRIEQLHDMIAAMQQAQTNAQTQEAQKEAKEDPLVTKDDETAFGADLIDLSRRVVRDEFQALREDFLKELRGLQGKVEAVETTAKQTAQERFESKMDQANSTWREIDADPAFLAWLRESKVRWGQFTQAVQQLDHVAASEIIEMYAGLKGMKAQQREQPKTERKAELEKQLAPGKSKSVDTSAKQTEDKKTWTRSDITSVYAKKRDYSQAEFAKLEREIAAAQRENRVDYSR